MKNIGSSGESDVRWLSVVLVLIGLLLITSSFQFPAEWLLRRELAKELGIVIFAVFTISLAYEYMLAEKHQNQFLARLRKQIEQGENNAAACERLGIIQIFPTRDVFEMKYPFSVLVSHLTSKDTIRITARTLFLTMTHPDGIKKAIRDGANIELCILNPTTLSDGSGNISSMNASEIDAAIGVFKDEIVQWIKNDPPTGSVELRRHRFPFLDSCLMTNTNLIWDLSFGRDLTSKRIFLVDRHKMLGQDLEGRYEKIWKSADDSIVFKYSNGRIIKDWSL